MQSIKSNALEPTRSEWATLSRGQAIVRIASVYGLPILTLLSDHLFLAAAARHVSDLAQRAVDPRRQGDHRDAVAGRDPADDGRPNRSHRRLWHRHVAHSRHQPAGVVRRSLAAGDDHRHSLRRIDRPHQRFAGRSGADRFVHRHARHRHDPLCACALAHGWAPGGGIAFAWFPRDQLDHGLRNPDSGDLCPRSGHRAVDRQRAPADRTPHLCDRRQREGRRAQRHSGARLCHRRICRLPE